MGRRLPSWRLTRRFVAASILLVACEGSPKVIDWDLSKSHRPQDVGWQRADLDSYDIDAVASVRVVLPQGRIFEAGDEVRDIILGRDGDLLRDIQITFEEQTAEEAYGRAKALIREWGLPGRNIDEWFAEARGKTGLEAAEVDVSGAFAELGEAGRIGHEGPYVTVQIRYSFDDDRPFLVGFELLWP